jgi:hypothetical protein
VIILLFVLMRRTARTVSPDQRRRRTVIGRVVLGLVVIGWIIFIGYQWGMWGLNWDGPAPIPP